MIDKESKRSLEERGDELDSYFQCITSCYGIAGEDTECITNCIEVHLDKATEVSWNASYIAKIKKP